MKKVSTSIYITEETKDKIDKLVEKTNGINSVSQLIEYLIAKEIANEEHEEREKALETGFKFVGKRIDILKEIVVNLAKEMALTSEEKERLEKIIIETEEELSNKS